MFPTLTRCDLPSPSHSYYALQSSCDGSQSLVEGPFDPMWIFYTFVNDLLDGGVEKINSDSLPHLVLLLQTIKHFPIHEATNILLCLSLCYIWQSAVLIRASPWSAVQEMSFRSKDPAPESYWMNHHPMTMMTWYSKLLKLCKISPMSENVTAGQSLAVELFIVIDKADTIGCFKIIWRIIQRTALQCSVAGW